MRKRKSILYDNNADAGDFAKALQELNQEFPGAEYDDSLINYISYYNKRQVLRIKFLVKICSLMIFFIIPIALFLLLSKYFEINIKPLLFIKTLLFTTPVILLFSSFFSYLFLKDLDLDA